MKKMSKVLALVLTLAMIIGATLVTGVVSVSADDVVVWEGVIDMDFTTKNTVAIINSDDSLTQALRDDLAQNGTASKYVITSSDSSYINGPSGYVTWGFYQETPIEEYLECWAPGGDISNGVLTEAEGIAGMNLKVNLCLFSDGTGDQAHVGSIKIVATHAAGATPVTTKAPTPQVDPQTIISQGNQVWSGTFDMDFTTTNTMAMLKNDEMNDAIRNDIATNGFAKAYAVVADAEYVSGESGYASYCFYQETPEYLEAWADKGSGVTSSVWTDASQLAQMGNKVQLALCCDTDGDVIHLNSLTIYAMHDGVLPTQPIVTEPVVTEPIVTEPVVTEPIVTEPVVTEPIATETGAPTEAEPTETAAPTEAQPTETVAPTAAPTEAPSFLAGDANNDGVINMKDVLVLRKAIADIAVEMNAAAADYNADGAINMKDVLGLRKLIAAQ